MTRSESMSRALEHLEHLRKKYGMSPFMAYMTREFNAFDRISYEIISDELSLG